MDNFVDESDFLSLELKFDILKRIGFRNHEMKLWAMIHLNKQGEIDQEEWGNFACQSFVNKGKNYTDMMDVIDKLVIHDIFYVPDEKAYIKKYKFRGEAQQQFNYLLTKVRKEIQNKNDKDVLELFDACLKAENENKFFEGNSYDYFRRLRTPDKIDDFLYKFANSNATSFVMFLLNLTKSLIL